MNKENITDKSRNIRWRIAGSGCALARGGKRTEKGMATFIESDIGFSLRLISVKHVRRKASVSSNATFVWIEVKTGGENVSTSCAWSLHSRFECARRIREPIVGSRTRVSVVNPSALAVSLEPQSEPIGFYWALAVVPMLLKLPALDSPNQDRLQSVRITLESRTRKLAELRMFPSY